MERSFESLIESWDGLAVLVRHDAESGAWIFVALHDDTLGPPVGGTRMRLYARPADGLRDALRLAEGMTLKWAALGLAQGGGKAVLAVPEPLEGPARAGLIRRFGRLVESLGGLFATGRDLGTTDDDMLELARVTSRVHRFGAANGQARDPGPFTARGVQAAMRAVAAALDGDRDLRGRTVAVVGLGAVGAPLARGLAAAGARLIVADLDADRAERVAAETAAAVLPVDEAPFAACDILAPCATGAVLDARTIPRLRCRAVVGAANNQLASEADAERLQRRAILYAPDFVCNGGAALASVLIRRGESDERRLAEGLDGIEDALQGILAEAAARNESPHAAAIRLARGTIERARRLRTDRDGRAGRDSGGD